MLSAGAFSDEKVVAASQKIMCVFVENDWGKKNTDLQKKYGVNGWPDIVFVDPDGTKIEDASREAGALAKQMETISAKYNPTAEYAQSWDKGLEQAKQDKKPIVYVFVTAKQDSKDLETALGNASLKDLRQKFVFVKGEIKKDGEDAKKFGVAASTVPVILILDPGAEKPEEKPLKKLSGKKSSKELKTELEAALKKFTGGK